MNGKKVIIEEILTEKLIAIIRLKEQNAMQGVIEALVAGNIKVLEITSNTPGFSDELEKARIHYPNILIGAGTVIDSEIAKEAIAMGAQFLVTPNTDKKVADVAMQANVPLVMGALTPTEIANALDYGADIIKLFPAGNLGISYFKSLKGPFDKTPFFAVGGIHEENIQEWFGAGIHGIGLGSGLVKSTIKTMTDLQNITEMAKKFLRRVP